MKMKIRENAFSVNGLILGLVLSSAFCGTGALLRRINADDLCYGTFTSTLDLRFQKTAILSSLPTGPVDCEITLKPERDSSVVIAFQKYSLGPGDRLTFRDIHDFQLSLEGEGFFIDERKSLTFDGPLTIHYVTNNTYEPNRLKFYLVFTQVHDAPCSWNEFKCRNNKCIPRILACDNHNHCGTASGDDNCGLNNFNDDDEFQPKVKNFPYAIAIIVVSVIMGIIIIALAAALIRGCVIRKKKTQQSQLPTAASASQEQPAAASAPQEQPAAVPSVFARIRQSFRSVRRPTAPPLQTVSASEHASESYEVPAMYPHLPSAPDSSGVDNPVFKSEEEFKSDE